MKLVRVGEEGKEIPGAIGPDLEIRDISSIIGDVSGDYLSNDQLARLREVDLEGLPVVEQPVRYGPCIAGVRNFIAVGLNYADHARETNAAIPEEPVLFSKAATCISGPDDPIVLLPGSTKTDWEAELAFVIGEPAYRVTEQEALDHVAGYCVCNDVSEREWQLERGGQWIKGKSAPTYGPLGPWLVTRDEVADIGNLDMWLDVNGKRMQSGSTSTMI
ncbi:MAG: fumarylacetoacetate hydrolase family protein, partial [Oricola sp.]|nr:fumarylacetoacetate hydrolase family protein [Oricola sp.]